MQGRKCSQFYLWDFQFYAKTKVTQKIHTRQGGSKCAACCFSIKTVDQHCWADRQHWCCITGFTLNLPGNSRCSVRYNCTVVFVWLHKTACKCKKSCKNFNLSNMSEMQHIPDCISIALFYLTGQNALQLWLSVHPFTLSHTDGSHALQHMDRRNRGSKPTLQ